MLAFEGKIIPPEHIPSATHLTATPVHKQNPALLRANKASRQTIQEPLCTLAKKVGPLPWDSGQRKLDNGLREMERVTDLSAAKPDEHGPGICFGASTCADGNVVGCFTHNFSFFNSLVSLSYASTDQTTNGARQLDERKRQCEPCVHQPWLQWAKQGHMRSCQGIQLHRWPQPLWISTFSC